MVKRDNCRDGRAMDRQLGRWGNGQCSVVEKDLIRQNLVVDRQQGRAPEPQRD